MLRSAPTGKKDDCAIESEKKKERIGAGCSETQSKFLYKWKIAKSKEKGFRTNFGCEIKKMERVDLDVLETVKTS